MIFVFGSNLAGRHGKGAALEARIKWGAEYGVGEGISGNAYAIPTKDVDMSVLSLDRIRDSVQKFSTYVDLSEEHEHFLVTPIGSGLAGYDRSKIADIFYEVFSAKASKNKLIYSHHWFSDTPWWRFKEET